VLTTGSQVPGSGPRSGIQLTTANNSVFPQEVDIIGHECVRKAILTLNVLDREPFRTPKSTRVPVRIASLKQQVSAEKDAAPKAKLSKDLTATEALICEPLFSQGEIRRGQFVTRILHRKIHMRTGAGE
jgi:hypothetical protein